MTPAQARILVVEDEAHMRTFLRTTLEHNGYPVVEVPNAGGARLQLTAGGIRLVLLDLGLPDTDGIEFTAVIRRMSDVPIIVISARDTDSAKIEALDSGANDYVTKPFSAGELLARIRAALRIASKVDQAAPVSKFEVGELRVDLERRLIWQRGK